MPARMKERYQAEIVPALTKEFNYQNPMEVPTLHKIVVNIGVGEAAQDARKMEPAVRDLTAITGQQPIVRKAKKSIAAFKLREGMTVGCMVTLRGERMWHFMDKLVNIALPRVRDFRGISDKAFDGRGNYSLGIKEQLIFPEIEYDKIDKLRGLEVSIVTTAKNDEESKKLLELLGMPFARA